MNRRWITIAFAVSVALNLFFLGVAAARLSQRAQWRAERRGDPALAMPRGPAAAAGPAGLRGPRWVRGEPLSWLSDSDRAALRPQREALVASRLDAERVLTADPFDATKFRSALEALRTQTTQIQSALHERLVQRAEAAGAEERRNLAALSWGTPGERPRPPRHRD